jgi:hypothetical protein
MNRTAHPCFQFRVVKSVVAGCLFLAVSVSISVGGNSSVGFQVVSADVGAMDDRSMYTFALVPLDANGDGITDLAIGNHGEASELWIGDGNGGFTKAEAGQFDDANGSLANTCLLAEDFNGDGKPDLAAGNYTVWNDLYTNNGYGVFTKINAGAFDDYGYHTLCMASFDVDSDGDLDIAEGTYHGCHLYKNNGQGLFSMPDAGQFDDPSYPVCALAVFDVNGDGKQDLVVGYENQIPRIYTNNGQGVFSVLEAVDFDNVVMNTKAFAITDINGDGYKDIVVGNFDQPNRIFLNNGQGLFLLAEAGDFDDENRWTCDLEAIDMDHDGDMDLVTASWAWIPGAVYRNDGSGSFTKLNAPAIGAEATLCRAMASFDIDRDPNWTDDLVFANWGLPLRVYLMKPEETLESTLRTIAVRAKGTSYQGSWPCVCPEAVLGTKTISSGSYLDYKWTIPEGVALETEKIAIQFSNIITNPADRIATVEHVQFAGRRVLPSEAVVFVQAGGTRVAASSVVKANGSMVFAEEAERWTFDEGEGSWIHDVARTNWGWISGASWVVGRNGSGSALWFDGVDDYVDSTAFIRLTDSPYTIEAWIKPETSAGNHCFITRCALYYEGGLLKTTTVSVVYKDQGSNLMLEESWDGQGSISASTPALDGNWHHIATTYDGTDRRLYIDGVLVQQVPKNGIFPEWSGPSITIGAWYDRASRRDYFRGTIDDLSIWRRARTSSEIAIDAAQ